MVLNVATPVVHDDRLFVTAFYDGSLMARLDRDKPAAEIVWRQKGANEQHTEALHSIISTPYFDGEYVYGVDSYGELRCLDAKTGDRIWESLDAVPHARWATIHFVQQRRPDVPVQRPRRTDHRPPGSPTAITRSAAHN